MGGLGLRPARASGHGPAIYPLDKKSWVRGGRLGQVQTLRRPRACTSGLGARLACVRRHAPSIYPLNKVFPGKNKPYYYVGETHSLLKWSK